EPTPTVSVAGEVRKPGTYRTSGQASIRDAVYLAGGLSPDAELDSAQLFRVDADGSSKIFSVNLGEPLSGNSSSSIMLHSGDGLLHHGNMLRVEPSIVEIKG